MPAEKAIALVLRVVEFSETSSVVTLFTREMGKIHAMAKGARRPKGPFESALDLLALCRIVFLRKSPGVLDLLTEAKLQKRFRPRDRELACLYAGYYVAELLTELTDDSDPHPELFDAAVETLQGLAEPGTAVASLVARFELTALRLLGHLPSLEQCVECGRPVEATGRVAFGMLVGGVLCQHCKAGQRNVVAISAGVLRAMIALAASGDAWRRLELDSRTRGELRAVLNHYLSHLLGHKPRMHEYLG
ncbi:MAG TPA: DNA repair protein RecO [Pirellulales bacterium]|jgi:DNA repair protein RecO (recombination protein O)|nr:DNA repair protein RecO [Pirellulales bacterium]